MSLRQRVWAKKKRLELRRKLGMHCQHCGSKFYAKLQFDCIIPQGHFHHRIEWSWRMSFYISQFKKGNLQLLCEKCNMKKAVKDKEYHDSF